LSDKVQKIIDTFKMLSPENQSVLLEFAYNILNSENSMKQSVNCKLEHEEKICDKGDIKQ
jgi:hypothetical protein